MAAMDLVRSLSLASSSPESSSLHAASKSPTPEPHYRLSRLNTPPLIPPVRSPSLISRSVSAGMPFAFKRTESKEKERARDIEKQSRSPEPEDRPSSRFGFTLRKKVSLASLRPGGHDETMLSRSVSATPSIPPISAPTVTPPSENKVAIVLTSSNEGEEDEDISDLEEEKTGKVPERFVKRNGFRTRHKMKVHPYDAPYMLAFDPVVLEAERYAHYLLRRLLPSGSPTFYLYSTPPSSVLDLGCGQGMWLNDAARLWRSTNFFGFDLVDVTIPAITDGSLPNVRFVRGDFNQFALPFSKDQFELVRVANLSHCIPHDRWEFVLREIYRVLVPDGRLEFLDDQAVYSFGEAPTEEEEEEEDVAARTLTPNANTPRPHQQVSEFFDSDEDDDNDDEEDGVIMTPSFDSGSDSASERSSFTDASTLIGDPSERGSVELKKGLAPGAISLEYEPVHRPFSGVDHLIISIPPSEKPSVVVNVVVDGQDSPSTPMGPLDASLAAAAAVPVPLTPTTDVSEAHETPFTRWTTRRTASRDLERVFQRMIASQHKMHTRPADLVGSLLSRIFAEGEGSGGRKGKVDQPETMHLKLAPIGAEERPGVVVRGLVSHAKPRMSTDSVRKVPKVSESAKVLDSPVPSGLSAKAAERLGIVGSGAPPIKRPRALSAEFSDDEDEFDEADRPAENRFPRPTLGRGSSSWVAPGEWDAPPVPIARSNATLLVDSPSTKTIGPSASTRTITGASSTKTIKQMTLRPSSASRAESTHKRGGSAASTHSTLSVASGSWNEADSGPPRYSSGRRQHPGLILWPSTFIPVPPLELEMHATRHMQTLLACKPALAEFVAAHVDPVTGQPVVSDQEFEDAIWDYEWFVYGIMCCLCSDSHDSFRRPRYNWPELPEARLEEETEEDTFPLSTARSSHHAAAGAPPKMETPVEKITGRAPFEQFELTHVRTIRVLGAVKGGV
ncbi:unnamed protein product [Mycena citricolor]|uniref:Methyltransferase domain-containing protein n=1 Tax=Mycena citricolor TaxID=2018698 RepID=A0AAD2K5J2_9AGAR|nr:unnamed protein product [Mycena citricolor]